MTHDPEPSPAASTEERLFGEFPPTTYDEWRQAAEKTLKGVPFEKKLITKTYEGIDLRPIYVRADTAGLPHMQTLPGLPPYVRGTEPLGYVLKPWEVCQELPYGAPAEVNRAARADVARGQTALNLPLDRATLAGLDPDAAATGDVGQGGVSLASAADVTTILDGVTPAQPPLLIQAGAQALPVAALVLAAARRQGASPEQVRGCIGMDPLGTLAAHGTLSLPLKRAYDEMAQLSAWAAANAPELRTISIALHPYHDGGGNAVQELAFALATGVAYIRALLARGLAIDTIAAQIQFSFSIGAHFFMEIAKLRAARLLWSRVVAAFGGSGPAQKMAIHARTSAWTKTRSDANNNMLRATAEAFAGVMGGCDSLHVSPFDEAAGLPDDFSRRIARNVHIILRQECNFFRLVDPAGGASSVETLTDELARSAWTLFQEIERQGGMAQALQAGFPQAQVARMRTQRLAGVAQRKDVIVGANLYPNLKERPVEVRKTDSAALQRERTAALQNLREASDPGQRSDALATLAQAAAGIPEQVVEAAIAAAMHGATLGDLTEALRAGFGAGPTVGAIPPGRASEQFEALRAAAEAYAARTGQRPQVFLANMGPVAQHKARSDFATGFFETGGFGVSTNDGFATVEAAAQAAQAAGAPIVVICSADDTYPAIVPPLTQALKAARPTTTVILAGYPADQVESYRQAGVDEFIHLRANCYEVLARLQKQQGVMP